LIEQNNPVPVGKDEIKPYKEPVEKIFANYNYRGKVRSLADLILKINPEELYVMSDTERDTYLMLRDGMQIFKAISTLLSEKTGLKKKLIETPASQLSTDKELNKLREFCYNYATYASSLYMSRKLEAIIQKESPIDGAKGDLSAITFDFSTPEEVVIKRLLVPAYVHLIDHEEKKDVLKAPAQFPMYMKEIFDKYVELALARKNNHADLLKHVEGYQFRIMDDFVVLEGFNDRSVPRIKAVEQQVSFQPITLQEIVGNQAAKRKLTRYIERLVLYDTQKQSNPIIELGGLSWSNNFDGLPGTGKTMLFRYIMTLHRELCKQVGIKGYLVSIDPSIKDEFYGKTGKILIERLSVTNDPLATTIAIMDDLDLLTNKREFAQGADNDINSILMQYLDGAFTVRRGSVMNFAASNKPTGLDEALRNRFTDRVLIEGPVTSEDFADMVNIVGKKLLKRGLLQIKNGDGYVPFATQDQRDEKGKWSVLDVSSYMADKFAKYKSATVIDFGRFMADLKQKNPRITGRSANAIMESIKERCADFDVPREWFEKRELFLEQSYDRKLSMLAELYNKITPDILFQEAIRYFDSEERFRQTETEGQVMVGYNNLMWDVQGQLKYYEEQVKFGGKSQLMRLQILKRTLSGLSAKAEETVREAIRHAEESND
jgi:AAA+ superfamily predicted ATPase